MAPAEPDFLVTLAGRLQHLLTPTPSLAGRPLAPSTPKSKQVPQSAKPVIRDEGKQPSGHTRLALDHPPELSCSRLILLFLFHTRNLYVFSAAAVTNCYKLGGLKQEECILPWFWKIPKSTCQQGHTPSEGSRKESSPAVPAHGGSWRSLACRRSPPVLASIFTWPSVCLCPLLIRTQVAGLRAPQSSMISF